LAVAEKQHGSKFSAISPQAPTDDIFFGNIAAWGDSLMSNRAISILSGVVFVLAAIESASAADMAVKAPPPPPAPVYSWTGWYVGGNVGYSWNGSDTYVAGTGNVETIIAFPPETASLPFAFSAAQNDGLKGVIGGAQLGYNYQFGPNWVLGFETDFQDSGERGNNQFTGPFSGLWCAGLLGPGSCAPTAERPFNATAATGYEAKIDWFGTVRGRLGVLVGDQLLIYGTGGLAYGRFGISGNTIITGLPSNHIPIVSGPPSVVTTQFDASKTDVGFTVGGGMEGKFSYWLPSNWTWRVEYLYLDLGSIDTAPTPFATGVFPLVSTGTTTTHTHFNDNIVRVGLNYQFH
jgi:outer membrane immunogenic protein